jgi:hypothetical protein
MAKKPGGKKTTTVTGPRRVLRPRNEAARALREAIYRPRISKNPKVYTRKGREKPVDPEPDTE